VRDLLKARGGQLTIRAEHKRKGLRVTGDTPDDEIDGYLAG
jgi:hypothetical protein